MTVAIDLDGVVHGYSQGWNGGSLYDDPVPGAIEGLHAIMTQEAVFILTARADLGPVVQYLRGHGIPAFHDPNTVRLFWNETGSVLVTNRKLPARAYVDDRGIRHTSWDQTMRELYPEDAETAPTPVHTPRIGDPTRWHVDMVRREHARMLTIVARYLEEYDVPGLAQRLADGNIVLPDVANGHGELCLCPTCRPDDEWGPPGRMVLN